jgi:hypothetical protein
MDEIELTKMTKAEYQKYLMSTEWQHRKSWVLNYWGNRCLICNSPDNLEVHHRTYERVGEELFTDLIPLCSRHHSQLHLTPWEIIIKEGDEERREQEKNEREMEKAFGHKIL